MKNSFMPIGLGLLGLAVILSSCKEEELPALTTAPVTNITMTSATSGGAITYEGSSSINAKGVCWTTDAKPTIADKKTNNGSGSGSYTSNMTDLIGGTTYYIRAYATNKVGTSYGNEETFTTSPSISQPGGQIIADHTVVDKYDDIPQYYIDKVKEMWLVIAGESHSRGYFNGLTLLEAIDPAYAVNWTEAGTPEAYTTSHLRTSRATWGDLSNESGWIYSYGEEDWWTSETAINRTQAGITYCNTNNLTISAFGFGWCYDPDIDINDYLTATQGYIDYCNVKGYSTKVFFTTGPLEGVAGRGCYNYYRWPIVRNYVASDESRILFDYADILCYDNDGTPTTKTCNGVTTPAITSTNLEPTEDYHISEAGAIRLAKAMWWMLARIAGWDGN